MSCKISLCCYNNTVTFFWLVGQVVKTPPSQGGIRGSIPLRAVFYYCFYFTSFLRCIFLLEVTPPRCGFFHATHLDSVSFGYFISVVLITLYERIQTSTYENLFSTICLYSLIRCTLEVEDG